MIELECMAAAWAMRKCRQFLEGLPSFQLFTDHRPLIPILNDYHLDKLDNPRILRLRLSMQRYVFRASWVPGKENVMADALSRSPVDRPSTEDEMAEGPQSFAARVNVVDTMETGPIAVVRGLRRRSRPGDDRTTQDDPERGPERKMQPTDGATPLLAR
jgi:hypothetical protein